MPGPSSSDERVSDQLWYKDAIIYQLHLKSFFDSNDDGIGDFPGIDFQARLYRRISALMLCGCCHSTRRHYWMTDMTSKTTGTFIPTTARSPTSANSCARLTHAGIRVITELVVNHTSDQHPWFQRARKAKPGSPWRNFYVWSDTDQKYAGTRIIFVDSERSNWTWDPVAGAYYWHRFYSHQPDLNFDNPQVLKAVLSVMRFWLQTRGRRFAARRSAISRRTRRHEQRKPSGNARILKRLRAELDARFPGRMLLAEVNQWPEDCKDYFGDGDECHMAFHFPLMPRMYMAIAREDRFPISDIMRQTPPIPENCQWAIFLRNHDELTLEMVTDSERDYLVANLCR